MKKFTAIIVSMLLMLTAPAYAAGNTLYAASPAKSPVLAAVSQKLASTPGKIVKPVAEPNVRIIVNNQQVKLTDDPISFGGSILLSLRSTMAVLGIPYEDKYIVLDNSKKTVAIFKGDQKLSLAIGSKTAYIDDKTLTLNAAPQTYAKKTYIPVQFLAVAMDMKTAWDSASKTVYLRDAEQFEAMSKTLAAVNTAMGSVKKLKIATGMKLDISKTGMKAAINADIDEELDRTAGRLYQITKVPFLSGQFSFEAFYADRMEYMRNTGDKGWVSKALSQKAFDSMLTDDTNLASFNSFDVLAACMEEEQAEDPGLIVLKGSVYPKMLVATIEDSANITGLKADKYDLEAYIDTETNLVQKLVVTLEGTFSQGGTASGTSASGSSKTSGSKTAGSSKAGSSTEGSSSTAVSMTSGQAKVSSIKAQTTIEYLYQDESFSVEIPDGIHTD